MLEAITTMLEEITTPVMEGITTPVMEGTTMPAMEETTTQEITPETMLETMQATTEATQQSQQLPLQQLCKPAPQPETLAEMEAETQRRAPLVERLQQLLPPAVEIVHSKSMATHSRTERPLYRDLVISSETGA